VVVQTESERVRHGEVKSRIAQRLMNAVDAAALRCDVFIDSMVVEVSDDTAYEPDVVLRCGKRLPPDAVKVTDPLLVVEVLSPSTQSRDTGDKLEDYFLIPSLRHYVIANPVRRTLVHHARDEAGVITTRILGDRTLRFDPPGIEIADLFPPE
jgi:Uma2 family endonuclease